MSSSLGRRGAALLTAGLVLCAGLLAPPPARAETADPTAAAPARSSAPTTHVVAISIDGLNPRALKRLGRDGAPNLWAVLRDQGAGTLNARSQVEMTLTLPNHTSMVTGRRIAAGKGGHGVTWNDETVQKTVQRAAGHTVSSVFEAVEDAGGSTAVYSTKQKFTLFQRSWPSAVDGTVIAVERDKRVARALVEDLTTAPRTFSFLHLGKPDQLGHDHGWLSAPYLKAVAKADRLVGKVLATIRSTPSLAQSTTVILTADHGGVPGSRLHGDKRNRENYRVPFGIWGAGVTRADLYALNPDRLRPGRSRPKFAGAQPVRNGDLANLALDLLGLGPVPGSLWNARQDLDWR